MHQLRRLPESWYGPRRAAESPRGLLLQPDAQSTDIAHMHESAYHLDIICGDSGDEVPAAFSGRPWIGVQFDCCNVYARIYRRTDTHFYLVRCPKCSQKTTVRVGPGGVTSRLFKALAR